MGTSKTHKIVVVGGGTAGLTASHQLLRTGKFSQDDIAVIDPATWHHYQPGWTLVSGGLNKKEDFRQPLKDLINPKLRFYNDEVGGFKPEENYVTLGNGDKLGYEQLIVAPGIRVEYESIRGLEEALKDPSAPVSCIYSYDYCEKAFETVRNLQRGKALFTQPAGVVKCAGAPQKVMWLSWDRWSKAGLYKPGEGSPINITFATGLPVMFGVPKYSATLDRLRQERGVEALFQHNLIEVNGNTAIFKNAEGESVSRHFDLLHAVPKMGPINVVKNSALADSTGFVEVDQATLRHKKFGNVWSIGDAASLPTSKTAAAITAQAPIMVHNLMKTMEGKQVDQDYDGYTSCPLLTGNKKVLLAEFKYGGVPKETFGMVPGLNQGTPHWAFYHLKKDFFPWVYKNFMIKGTWGGPKGFIR